MGVRIEEAGEGRYGVIYGAPEKGFGVNRSFDSLDEALTWANTDASGGLLIATDGSAIRSTSRPP